MKSRVVLGREKEGAEIVRKPPLTRAKIFYWLWRSKHKHSLIGKVPYEECYIFWIDSTAQSKYQQKTTIRVIVWPSAMIKLWSKNSHSKLIIYLKENVIVKRNFKCLVPGDFPDTEKNLISRTKYLSILNLHKWSVRHQPRARFPQRSNYYHGSRKTTTVNDFIDEWMTIVTTCFVSILEAGLLQFQFLDNKLVSGKV